MSDIKSIALVGRPNVGKSRLFNRILGRRVSIVHDRPGVTRDIVAEKMRGGILLMDTGGIGATLDMTEKVIAEATNEQAEFAIGVANLILFVVDSQEGVVPLDLHVAEIIRKSGANAVLVVNKIDEQKHKSRMNDFYKLGFKRIVAVSAEHGLGFDQLMGEIEKDFGPLEDNPEVTDTRVKICVAGRPNVGKSSIGNRLLNSQRLIVSDIAGTTRDSVRCELDYTTREGKLMQFEFYDTAGLRTKRKINTSLDYLSTIRTKQAIENCEIVMLVIDAMEGVSELDKKLSGEILEAGAAIMIVVNKWDYARAAFAKGKGLSGYDNIVEFRKQFEESVRKELFFLSDSPIHFISAKEDADMSNLLENAYSLHKKIMRDLPTGKINSFMGKLLEENPPKYVAGKRFKIYYALQTSKRPVTIRFFCNREDCLDSSYKRFLEKNLREEFRLGGLSLKLDLVGKKSLTAEERISKKNSSSRSDKKSFQKKEDKKPAKKKAKKEFKRPLRQSLKARMARKNTFKDGGRGR